jgi:hypothetical protein
MAETYRYGLIHLDSEGGIMKRMWVQATAVVLGLVFAAAAQAGNPPKAAAFHGSAPPPQKWHPMDRLEDRGERLLKRADKREDRHENPRSEHREQRIRTWWHNHFGGW